LWNSSGLVAAPGATILRLIDIAFPITINSSRELFKDVSRP
jgi:hypothetical protein